MKNLIILICISSLAGNLFSQDNKNILMTISNKKITVSEFENIYHKNNSSDGIVDKKSLDEYVDLFINFKLKVQAAEDLGLDTAKSFIDELSGYRKQLSQPYLIDKELNENLIVEAHNRINQDVHASHILIKLDPEAPPSDTLKAYNKIMDIRNKVMSGTEFGKLAAQYSEDPSAKDNGGDLGYFTAFQMVYPFESAAFNTPVNEVSMPALTRFGYHIIKVHAKRPAIGQIKVAHIMVRVKDENNEEDKLKAVEKIGELYAKLEEGEDFGKLAKMYSDDKASAQKGGGLPWFGTNRMVKEFEDAAFSLKNPGDMSKPVKTPYGWHVIKLMEKKPIGSLDEMRAELKSKVSRDGRASQSRKSLIIKLKSEYGFKPDLSKIKDFYTLIDEGYFRGDWNNSNAQSLEGIIFKLDDTKYNKGKSATFSQKDFYQYLMRRSRKQTPVDPATFVDRMFDKFVEEACIKFEEDNLEWKYPEFKALMQEYRDGILLFELMDEKVWSKAVKDTSGLKSFYKNNAGKYMWDNRVEATIYSCKDQATADAVKKAASKEYKKELTPDQVRESAGITSQLDVKTEKGIFTKEDQEILQKIEWKTGISESVNFDGKIVFVNIGKTLEPSNKSLKEAKGLVTADYQSFLEKEWIGELRKTYKISVDEEVLKQVK